MRGRTALIVTHRLSLARTSDRVLVLDGGRVVEDGPPDVLRARGGAYASLERTARGLDGTLLGEWPEGVPLPAEPLSVE